MSQQIMTIVSILQQILAEAGDVGDTEYMAKKAFDGKLITVTGAIDNINDTIEFVVPNGKRFYFHSAKIVITGHPTLPIIPGTTNNVVEADLKIDTVVKDTTNIGTQAKVAQLGGTVQMVAGTSYGIVGDGKFDVKGLSLVGDGAKKIEIENMVDNGSATATIIGFIEDTLTDPTLLAQSITVEASVAGETGDLPFLQERILSGNVFDVSGDINALADTIEFIVPNGKTAFMIEAKIINPTHVGASSSSGAAATSSIVFVTAALKIDGVEKDKTIIGKATAAGVAQSNQFGGGAGSGYGNLGDGKFHVKTLSLVGDGVKKIEIENILDSGSAFARMAGYLIDT